MVVDIYKVHAAGLVFGAGVGAAAVRLLQFIYLQVFFIGTKTFHCNHSKTSHILLYCPQLKQSSTAWKKEFFTVVLIPDKYNEVF